MSTDSETKAGSSMGRAPDELTGERSFEPAPAYKKRNRFRITWGEYLGREECPYMRRWVVETPLGSLRLHHWFSSDDERGFHDHPWWFVTLVLRGRYTDLNPQGEELMPTGKIKYRPSHHKHTVKVEPPGCWTLVLTGSHVRFWGFYVDGKFIKSNKYFLERGHHPCATKE